jgi:hypothetical protein
MRNDSDAIQIVFELVKLVRIDELRIIPKAALADIPKTNSFGAFTGSVTEPLIRKTVVSAVPNVIILESKFSVALFNMP